MQFFDMAREEKKTTNEFYWNSMPVVSNVYIMVMASSSDPNFGINSESRMSEKKINTK